MKRCPKCGNDTFIVTAHIAQDWLVDEYGNFLKVTEDCVEVTHDPDNEDIWACAECGYDAEGEKFEVQEKGELSEMSREELLLELLAETIPSDPNEFNSETGYGEPQHWMTLPYDRSLEIVYEETGDNNRYYSWRVHCNEKEFANDIFHSTMGVMDVNTSNDMSFDTRISKLNWAIKVAEEKPII